MDLYNFFNKTLFDDNTNQYVIDIARLICENKTDKDSVNEVLRTHHITEILDIKHELMSILTAYADYILHDHKITYEEKVNFNRLKLIFKIKEGDFIKYKEFELKGIILHQARNLYSDNHISTEEELFEVEVQELFNLSYDQYNAIKKEEIDRALKEGACVTNLNTALYSKKRIKY